MSQVQGQLHHKFKAFSGQLAADGTIGAIAGEVEAWAAGARVAPKSIGVEFLEAAQRLVLTIGYRDDEPPYGVGLTCVRLGRFEALDAPELDRLQTAMGDAGARLDKVLCHELYVTSSNDFMMVFMTHRG
ncbi:MAG: hypothetical protein HY909_11625 [Deltaproteobacteria bacterium]|nr:hypothetical protein [Deltaproteobacteria bacterium]